MVKLATKIIFLSICMFFLLGCDDGIIPLNTLTNSSWYKSQKEIITKNNSNQISGSFGRMSFALGQITAIKDDNLVILDDKIKLQFDNIEKVKIGDWVVARVQHDIKGRGDFAKEYRILTQNIKVPSIFQDDYKRIIALAIEKDWHLDVNVAEDGSSITISYGMPQEVDTYFKREDGSYSNERDVKALFYNDDAFNFIIINRGKMSVSFDIDELGNTPHGVFLVFADADRQYLFRCSNALPVNAISEITNQKISLKNPCFTLRSPMIRESTGLIATDPSTKARRDELQKAFEQAGFSGKWEIGDFGTMIYYQSIREFEVYMPCFNKVEIIKINGPNPDGFIFTLSPYRKEYMHIPLIIPCDNMQCRCQKFYYWRILDGWILEDSFWANWDFEFGDSLPNHGEVLSKILSTVKQTSIWTLPKRPPLPNDSW